MSETKTNEPVKQEGEFKLKKKTPKKLGITNNDPVKVDLTKPEATGEVVPDVDKVDIPKDDAIQIGETEKVDVGEQAGDSAKVDKQVQESTEDAQESSPIQEIIEEDKDKVKEIKKEIVEAKQEQQILNKPLPENIEKLIDFMESTGGTVEDYVALNKDYSSLDSAQLLSEYYKKTKPHLDQEEINFLMEDAFNFDEDVDEAREIRKKKLAYKEEVAKAKSYLESSKSKYYEEIKLKPSATGEQKEALNFYNNYKQQQELATKLHGDFRDNTKKLFSSDFKGFDFNVGDKKFRYGVKDPVKVGETQSDVQNFVSRFSNGRCF